MSGPPRIASKLLSLVLRGEEGAAFHGDLDERFAREVGTKGGRAATVWYWRRTLSVAWWTVMDRGRPSRRTTMGREARRVAGPGELVREAGLTLRTLRKAPGFVLPVVLLIGIGIGGVTAVFALVDHVLLRPLPYPNAERLYSIGRGSHAGPMIRAMADADAFEAWAIADSDPATLTGAGDPLQVEQALVSDGFFPFFGARPALGRLLAGEDFATGDAVVLSAGAWQRIYGGDPAIVGRTMRLDGRVVTVVGVLAEVFQPPQTLVAAHVDVWRAIEWTGRNLAPDRSVLKVAARLAGGATIATAQTQLDAIARGLAQIYPRNMTTMDGSIALFTIDPLHDATVQRERAGLGLLLAGVALLLVVACLNVAHLVLARGVGRLKEMSVRRALGAGTGALVRQLLLESVALGVAGGIVGLGLAWLGLKSFLSVRGADLPVAADMGLDPRIVAFACTLAAGTAVLFGLFPAIRSIGGDQAADLRGSSRSITSGRRTAFFHRAIVVAEVALSLMLVALTGVLLSSWRAVSAVDAGFDTDGLWTMPVTPTQSSSSLEYAEAMNRVVASLETVPGVESASYGLLMPFEMTGARDCCWNNAGMIADGRTRDDVRVLMQPVHADYFETLGIRMVGGETWKQAPAGVRPVPVVLSERLAIDFFGSAAGALDQAIRWPFGNLDMRVVGVAADTRHWGLDQPVPQFMYLPSWTVGYGFGRANLAVRARDTPPPNFARSLREAVWRVMPVLPVPVVRPMRESIRISTGGRQFNAIVFAAFGIVSLLLAAAGLYGTLLYHVRSQRRELGIRLALGAAPGHIERSTLLSGLGMALVGCAIGLPVTWAAGRILASRLGDLTPNDPAVLAIASAVLLATAAAASWLPARRAGKTDPLETLRTE